MERGRLVDWMQRASLQRTWTLLRTSFWFTPGLIVLGSILGAVLLVEFDAAHSMHLAEWSPRLFGAGADGSRAMLSAIATSMITVAGVVFSITMVTLSLTTTEYSPRVLRNFMRDTPTQVVLGVFVGIFAYALVVLRTINGGEVAFVPPIAVLAGLVYALAGTVVLIYFIHHVAQSIQAASILGRIAADAESAIEHLFPQELGQPPPSLQPAECRLPEGWNAVLAHRSGYVQSIDAEALLRQACECATVVRLRVRVGEYVSESSTLLEVGEETRAGKALDQLGDCITLARQRSIEQDAAYGLQQLQDIALRALSPAVNDPTTACMCINELGRLLARLGGRAMPQGLRFAGGTLRVIAPEPEFGPIVEEALVPVVRHSDGDVVVLAHLLTALEVICAAVQDASRCRALRPCLVELQRELSRVRPRSRSADLRRRLKALATQSNLRHS